MQWVETERADGDPRPRQFERSRLFSAGIVVNEGEPGRFNCLIRNISPGGAQIRLSTSQPVSASCYLINLKSGWAHRAQPVWRRGSLSGLRLSQAYAMTALPPHLDYIATLQ